MFWLLSRVTELIGSGRIVHRTAVVWWRNPTTPPVFPLSEYTIMSTRSRKRHATAEASSEQKASISSKATHSKNTRRAIKIEVEAETDVVGETPKPGKSVVVEVEETDESIYFMQTRSDKATAEKTTSPRSETKLKMKSPTKEPVKIAQPQNWEVILENIRVMRSTKTAAVDTMGCERTADLKQEPKVQRFQTLISLMLSSQTRDQVTYAAMERLKEKGLTVQSMIDVTEQELGETLKPVSFYKRKATYIKKTAEILRREYDDDIPKTVQTLCALPGVGPKMAYICMTAAWHENVGIGVDTHVHRISNRLQWTGSKGTSTPEKTREALESWLPKDIWQEVNVLLVGFGQEICLPIGPKCVNCLNKDICPSSSVKTKRKQTHAKDN